MSNILSQEEIDALLTAVTNGDNVFGLDASKTPAASNAASAGQEDVENDPWLDEDDTDKINEDRILNLYDFRRPDRVSKDQMRTLQSLHESYARQFSTTLTNYLRTFVEIEVVAVDQLTYSEFIMSISNPSCIHLFRMEPIEVTAIFEMNPSLVFFVIDRLFGGLGKSSEHSRELTPIEQNVIRNIISRGLDDLASVWEHMGDFSPKITAYETNPMFVQIAPPGETVILITFEVQLLKSSGLMSICFPHAIIDKLFSFITSESWITTQVQTTAETRKIVEEEIQELKVPLSVVMGQTKLTVRDLLQLEKDDILCLEKHKDDDLIVQIGGKSKMGGKSGIVGRKKAVKITKIIEPEVPGANIKYDLDDDSEDSDDWDNKKGDENE
ncbi:MAG: flagellar motor switch protein FliM [Chitinispirillales bacterium]|jgi:flagellar motor switch protein FliM|nr:flagellar motor switch protein FliM [Chitinispirillales bacterium]